MSPGPISQGLAETIAKRVEQIVRFGHTPELDAKLPIHFFAVELATMAQMVRDDSQFARPLPQMRRHAAKLAAFACALIDRIDLEGEEKDDDAQF